MAIILKDFYELMKDRHRLRLIAGQEGLNRSFRWMYLAEDMENTGFLNADEIIVTTGMSSRLQPDWLMMFLRELIRRGCPCLIINTGKYLTEADLTGDLIELCEQHHFPLFTMPWEIHLADLFQDCSNLIFEASRRSENLRSVLRTLLREDQMTEEMADILDICHYHADDCYCLCILDFDERDTSVAYIIGQMQRVISSFLYREAFFAFSYNDHFLILGHHRERTKLKHTMDRLIGSFLEKVRHVGISSCGENIFCLPRLYRQAAAALIMADYEKQSIFRFDDFGCMRVLFSVSDTQVLYEYYRSCIGEIEDYDVLHRSAYLDTLESYLRNNGQLAIVAEEMNCHRNTIYYRAAKLKEWLELDLGDGDHVFQLQLALNIRKYLEIFSMK